MRRHRPRGDERPGGRHGRTREHRVDGDGPGPEQSAGLRGFAGSRREPGPVVRGACRERSDGIHCVSGRRRVDHRGHREGRQARDEEAGFRVFWRRLEFVER
jgi:hypothetical protein